MNLLDKDLNFIWHPYTQMKDLETLPPLLIDRAEGVKLYDKAGNFYYDTISSWWCNVHGHNHPKIKDAIKNQLDKLEHTLFAGITHEPAIKLAEKIINITPPHITKVFYSDNGSTAVEVALKMSLQYWYNKGNKSKKRFVSLDHGYHGDTVGAMSISGDSVFNEIFKPLFFKTYKTAAPYCYRCPMGLDRKTCSIDCIEILENLLKKHHQEIAAIILEPLLMGAGGMIIYPKEYLEKVYELTKKYNIHLIVDEIATGFGRTGKMFAHLYTDIKPDFMCISKGITSGYLPLAATLTTTDIFDAFYADYSKKKTFYHGHTYTANPLACAAGIATLEIFEDEKTLDRIKNLIPILKNGLERMKDLPYVGDIRHLGMVGAIELVKDKKTKEEFSFKERIGYKIYQEALKHNLILRPLGNIIYLFLPLCIKEEDLKTILEKTQGIISQLNYH